MPNRIAFQLIDVFTSEPFGGNPLAIFDEAEGLSTHQMLKIAKELNLSESVFLTKPTHADADMKMRIFTPEMELPTAGHPTVGTAFYLLNKEGFKPKKPNKLRLEQKISIINVGYEDHNQQISKILMEQPLPAFEETFTDKKLVASLLSLKENDISERLPCRIVNCGNPFLIVPIKSLHSIQNLRLNHAIFEQILDEIFMTGIMAFTMETTSMHHLTHSRMLAPHIGVHEDAATGSAHGTLASYLHHYKLADLSVLCTGEQGYEMGRPSQIKMRIIEQEGQLSKVLVGGSCVHMGQGEILIPA